MLLTMKERRRLLRDDFVYFFANRLGTGIIKLVAFYSAYPLYHRPSKIIIYWMWDHFGRKEAKGMEILA